MRRFVFMSIVAALSPFAAAAEAAWPTKSIHLIVPFPAGGQLDVAARWKKVVIDAAIDVD